MAFYQVTHRLAGPISQMLTEDLGGDRGTRWTQEQLAALLRTVCRAVARSLRELERSGVIRTKKPGIPIADPELLQQWTQGAWN